MSTFKLCAFADEADQLVSGQIKALQENNIELLEVRGVNGKSVTDLTTVEMRELRKELDDGGIKVWSIGSPIGKIGMRDDFGAHLELFRHTLELAHIAGADKMRIFSFHMNDEDPVKCKDEVIDRMGKFVDVAKGSGISLCHENEKGIYGDVPERCVDILKAIPEISAVYDPANFIQCGAETLSAWKLLKPYIHYMHMKDALADKTVVPPGKGDANIPVLLEEYASIGGGVITLEPHLSAFVGLSDLEIEGKGMQSIIGNGYKTRRDAFDAGVNALKALI